MFDFNVLFNHSDIILLHFLIKCFIDRLIGFTAYQRRVNIIILKNNLRKITFIEMFCRKDQIEF